MTPVPYPGCFTHGCRAVRCGRWFAGLEQYPDHLEALERRAEELNPWPVPVRRMPAPRGTWE